jgi:hypothetical protein
LQATVLCAPVGLPSRLEVFILDRQSKFSFVLMMVLSQIWKERNSRIVEAKKRLFFLVCDLIVTDFAVLSAVGIIYF